MRLYIFIYAHVRPWVSFVLVVGTVLRLLDTPDHVREAVEFGVHWGTIVALAIML